MSLKTEPIAVSRIYRGMTLERKRQVVREVRALLELRGNAVSVDYMEQVLLGIRKHRCSEIVAKAIAEYFVGMQGMDVRADDIHAQGAPPAPAVAGVQAA